MTDSVEVEGDVTKISLAGVAGAKELVVAFGPIDEAEAINDRAVVRNFGFLDDEGAATIFGRSGVGEFGNVVSSKLIRDSRGAVRRRDEIVRRRKLRANDEVADFAETLSRARKKTRRDKRDVARSNRSDGKRQSSGFFKRSEDDE